jgi:hypothetical protein
METAAPKVEAALEENRLRKAGCLNECPRPPDGTGADAERIGEEVMSIGGQREPSPTPL